MADGAQTTSKKHRQFVSEPMGQKPATALSGVGPKGGAKLTEAGSGQASNVVGHYLVLNKDEKSFTDFMKDTAGSNTKHAGDCHKCVKEYTDANL